jgi:hypothetical protein
MDDSLSRFIQVAIEYGKSFEEAENYRKTNKLNKKVMKYYKEIISAEKDDILFSVAYLLNHENDWVRFLFSGAHLDVEPEECMTVLKELATKDNTIGTTAQLIVDTHRLVR